VLKFKRKFQHRKVKECFNAFPLTLLSVKNLAEKLLLNCISHARVMDFRPYDKELWAGKIFGS
jgi:hypothetical protein